MEQCAEFFGDTDGGSFFDFNTVSKNRHIKYPMLPDKYSAKLGGNIKVKITPKLNGEKRILSADIALMSSDKRTGRQNDALAIMVNSLIPNKQGRFSSNIIYTDTVEGAHSADASLMIRSLYDEYGCDYIVLDCAGVGLPIFDALARDIVSPDTGEIHPALSCYNDSAMAARAPRGADKVIWSIKANAQFNSECAMLLREGFNSGKIRLLVNEYEAEAALSEIKGYSALPLHERTQLQMPYIHTTLLISELVKLNHEVVNGKIRVYENRNERKDRYSSLSYNYYVAIQLEALINRRLKHFSIGANGEDLGRNIPQTFYFKAPKIR
jgi:hypothetical protein